MFWKPPKVFCGLFCFFVVCFVVVGLGFGFCVCLFGFFGWLFLFLHMQLIGLPAGNKSLEARGTHLFLIIIFP